MNRFGAVPLILIALIAAACGSDSNSTPAESGVPSGDAGTTPEAIVSLSPTATEMLFAIGAGEQVVAVDSLSNFPAEAPVTDLSGYQLNVESLSGYEPDLVVMTPTDEETTAAMDAIGATLLIQDAPADLDGVYSQIEELGQATGNRDGAAALVAQMQSDIEAILAAVPTRDVAPTYYHELDDTFFTATSDTFIGHMYALAGLENIADAAGAESGPYPELSAEYLLDADPDLIFLADTICCGQDAATVELRPGWNNLSAVQAGRIVELNDDIASRWGPRIVELLEIIVEWSAALEPAGT